jgi:hypothetical protein
VQRRAQQLVSAAAEGEPSSIGSILNEASPFLSVAIGSFGAAGRSRHMTA